MNAFIFREGSRSYSDGHGAEVAQFREFKHRPAMSTNDRGAAATVELIRTLGVDLSSVGGALRPVRRTAVVSEGLSLKPASSPPPSPSPTHPSPCP